MMFLALLLASLFLGTQASNCKQAWCGAGTGAWYRADTACEISNFAYTTTHVCFPTEVIAGADPSNEGFYLSLGVYSTKTGHGLDVGLTLSGPSARAPYTWAAYANDEVGWKSAPLSVDTSEYPCVDLSLEAGDNNITFAMTAPTSEQKATRSRLGAFTYTGVDPQLNLNKEGKALGFYLFFSVAQNKENTTEGAIMRGGSYSQWAVATNRQAALIPVDSTRVGKPSGYAPGPCCSPAEVATIHVASSSPFYAAAIDFAYVDGADDGRTTTTQ
ncbi:hypothetical protein PAPYR_10236 [Paratrimastix pyriformis]|uniref:Uncharacterized protein n=1 Tax=Paratrimastix pyriformis TaxID=342808 RepID=A0ABQ8U9A8_9EUKA|nr:hypothetical protein PAPYR_10236 [Paratrimastix pyriformis]|eukprot:GAFH01002862.1.p1 GENE.GAFH01002862.1~~GAFH01002862.1.p1  ORF type:complete len:273 (+),score=47.19 GAFH01002862.1:17-835(+)